jgi:hypothetical protein
MAATKARLEQLLGVFAVTVMNMADKPSADNDERLKDAIKKLAAALSQE